MLDAVGDLYMNGHSILGDFKAFKTGHALNNKLLRALLSDDANFEMMTISEDNQSSTAIEFLQSQNRSVAGNLSF